MLSLIVRFFQQAWGIMRHGCPHENMGTRSARGRLFVQCNDCGWKSRGIIVTK